MFGYFGETVIQYHTKLVLSKGVNMTAITVNIATLSSVVFRH